MEALWNESKPLNADFEEVHNVNYQAQEPNVKTIEDLEKRLEKNLKNKSNPFSKIS